MHRGLDKDVSVVVWGEFGRTPTINKDAGRDHWPRVSCALLAGGGMKLGQVIGKTDRWAVKRQSGRCSLARCLRRFITTWASIPTARPFPTSLAGRNIWWMGINR